MIKKLDTPGKRLGGLYLVTLVLWLAGQLVCFGIDRALPEVDLLQENVELNNIVYTQDHQYVSANEDPQMIYKDLELSARVIQMEVEFANPPGEMDLYYLTRPVETPSDEGLPFSLKKRAFAQPLAGNRYEYTLKPGRYTALRLDPGSVSDNSFAVTKLVANPKKPLGSYWVPSARSLLGLLLIPALAYCVVCTIIEGITRLRLKDKPSYEEE